MSNFEFFRNVNLYWLWLSSLLHLLIFIDGQLEQVGGSLYSIGSDFGSNLLDDFLGFLAQKC